VICFRMKKPAIPMKINHKIVLVYNINIIFFFCMVSGGLKVIVKNGRILREDLPTKLAPFVRIKAGSRIADSKRLSL
jgi:hypothetical protein